MVRRGHDRSISYPTDSTSLESNRSLESQFSLESQASLRSKRSTGRTDGNVSLRSSSNPRNPTDRLAAAPSPFSNTPFSRALSVQHASTTINYGGIGALPLYKAKSCNVDTIQDSPKIKEARSGLSTQQTLRVRAAKSWLQQRWRLCLLGAFLLLLFVSAVVRFSAYDPYRASQLQQEDILASVRCAIDNSLRQQYTPFAIRGPLSKDQPPRGLRYKAAQLLGARALALRHPGEPLGVCIMTADFWGLKSAGGTATAYHLLAQALAANPEIRVTFVGVTRRYQQCQEGVQAQSNAASAIQYRCLAPEHFVPAVVETHPYESLSHASLAWLKSNLALCEVVHVHEWGGVFVDVITASAYRQLKPGLRVVVEAHGGHFWSTQGSVQRPLDVTSLRIDAAERMGLQLGDALISPTHYMTAFLRERAWRLPKTSIVIPNVLPSIDAQQESQEGKVEKPVWRLAFFSRLEERKGLKVFVKAVIELQAAAAAKLDPRFEVIFVGADSRIDMRPSSDWLRAKTASWKVPVKILPNVERSEALRLLDQEGTLLVMCSLVDNMPYVLAEAAVKGVPLITFDVGGVGEMLHYSEHEDVVVMDSSATSLANKLREVLERGQMHTVQLSKHMLGGRDSWLKWHKRFAEVLSPKLEQEDLALMAAVQKSNRQELQVVQLGKKQSSVSLHTGICGQPGAGHGPGWNPKMPLLLLPPGYQMLNNGSVPGIMTELLMVGKAMDNGVGALSFGVELAGGQLAFPTGPTWHLYTGDDAKCMESVPLLLWRGTFCDTFFAHARVFRTYQSWVLIMMLRQAGLRVHTYPEVLFKAVNLTSGGDCNPDKAPVERHISFGSASNILGDPEEVMTNLYLAPFPRPATSLMADYPYEQGHKGWQIGYRATNVSEFRPLMWHPSQEPHAKPSDGTWGCPDAAQPYPAMHHSLVHPCTSPVGGCCGLPQASFNLRFHSFLAAPKGMLLMAYEVWPICGDGLTLQITHTETGQGAPETLMMRQIAPDPRDKPQRQKVEVKVPLHAGDLVDFMVHPHGNMDCDGVYIVDMQFWPDSGNTRTWES